jgi:sec-independent protein translocase protein TatB
MFLDIGWPELLLIGAVALVVIGPKDLPRALKVAGYWVRKARMMSREFQNSVEQMIRDAELEEVRKDLQKASEFDLEHQIQQTVDPDGRLAESLKPPEIPDYFDEPSLPLDAPAARTSALAADAVGGEPVSQVPDLTIEPELPFPEPLPPIPARQPEPS